MFFFTYCCYVSSESAVRSRTSKMPCKWSTSWPKHLGQLHCMTTSDILCWLCFFCLTLRLFPSCSLTLYSDYALPPLPFPFLSFACIRLRGREKNISKASKTYCCQDPKPKVGRQPPPYINTNRTWEDSSLQRLWLTACLHATVTQTAVKHNATSIGQQVPA